MSTVGPHCIAIGRIAQLAHQKYLANHWAQVQIDTPAESLAREATQPPREFTISPVLHLRGERYEVIAWLPGEHPPGAIWWEDLDIWVLLRRLDSVARPLRLFAPQTGSLMEPADTNTCKH